MRLWHSSGHEARGHEASVGTAVSLEVRESRCEASRPFGSLREPARPASISTPNAWLAETPSDVIGVELAVGVVPAGAPRPRSARRAGGRCTPPARRRGGGGPRPSTAWRLCRPAERSVRAVRGLAGGQSGANALPAPWCPYTTALIVLYETHS